MKLKRLGTVSGALARGRSIFGRDSVIDDPFGHRTAFGYATSGLRNRMSVIAPNLQTTTVGRNAWGIVHSSTAPNGAAWTSALDVFNRPGWVAGQYGDTTKYQYDALSALSVLTDAKGQADTLKRNALGWVYKHVYATGSADSAAYDSTGNVRVHALASGSRGPVLITTPWAAWPSGRASPPGSSTPCGTTRTASGWER